MNLSITQTYAKIGIETTPGRFQMKSQPAKIELERRPPAVNIHAELPKVEIDQYECFATSGLKNFLDLAREGAQLGYRQAFEYIGKVAVDGDTFAAIEQGGSPIADIAERDAHPEHEFGIVAMPGARPKISVRGGIQFQPEYDPIGFRWGVKINVVPGKFIADYIPANVNIFMRQYNSVDIRYVGSNMDIYA
ncbi:MAG TPA: hypothetical protein GXX36_07020 [Clostridiaceae bacterium]|nr:hypothetical protein [Clostridiaceae bacterium]